MLYTLLITFWQPQIHLGWQCFSLGNNFQCYPLVQSIFMWYDFMILNTILYFRYWLLNNHLLSSNITRCQVPSHVGAWFHNSSGYIINFYQMILSQLESTTLYLNWKYTYIVYCLLKRITCQFRCSNDTSKNLIKSEIYIYQLCATDIFQPLSSAGVAQWVRALALQAEGLVLESQLWQT